MQGIKVVHYELPNSSEIFVHRSGRTGRAGKTGSAILIHSSHQFRDVKAIEREVGCRFTEISVEDGALDMYGGMDQGSRFGFGGHMGGRFGDSGFGRSRDFGNSRAGRSGGYSGSSGGYGNSGGGRFGESGFGGQGSGRSGKFGGFGSVRSNRFGDRDDWKSGFCNVGGSNCSNGFGDFGLDRSGGFGSSQSGQGSRSNRFGYLFHDNDDGNCKERKFF